MKNIIRNIFIDTSIYESNNFFHGKEIQSLFYYSRIDIINLFMTTISKMELIDRMKKKLIEVRDDHNKVVNSINKKNWILKNLERYDKLEKSKLKIDEALKELIKKLEVNINRAKINIINSDLVNIEDVFVNYYNNLPPFNSREFKKYEFPDAFIIKTLDSWCKAHKKRIIVLTKDNDFHGYKSKRLIIKNEISKLLADISEYYDSLKGNTLTPLVNKVIESKQEDILQWIDNELDDYLILDIDYDKVYIERSKPIFIKYDIIELSPTYADVNIIVKVIFTITVIPSIHDINRSIFEDNIHPKKYTEQLTIPCNFRIEFNNYNRIKPLWINSNCKIIIDFSK